MIPSDVHYDVYGWMVNYLKNTSEIRCFAIIYTYTKEKGSFDCGLKYLAEIMQCSEPSARAAVQRLISKRLVSQEIITTGIGRHCRYTARKDAAKRMRSTERR